MREFLDVSNKKVVRHQPSHWLWPILVIC